MKNKKKSSEIIWKPPYSRILVKIAKIIIEIFGEEEEKQDKGSWKDKEVTNR